MQDFKARLKFIKIIFLFVGFIFMVKLFSLQVLDYEYYEAEARFQHEKRSVLLAKRGKILVKKNYFSEEYIPLATNNTLKMLFVDPLLLKYPKYNPKVSTHEQETGNPDQVADILAPILINAHCEKVEGCDVVTDPEKWSFEENIAISAYKNELKKIFSQTERVKVLLERDLSDLTVAKIKALNLSGIYEVNKSIWANPTKILDVDLAAEKLSEILKIKVDIMKRLLSRRPKRYVEVIHKIVPEVSKKILELKKDPHFRKLLRGVRLKDEHWRYYPEKKLGAQILGFVDNNNHGQYGIEGRFDDELKGRSGFIYGAMNTRGQRILGKDSEIRQAEDGADIILSIDRIIQGQVEKILEEDLDKYKADFGQIIVVEPKTGRILAMVNGPSFDPNEYGKVFLQYEVSQEQYEKDLDDETYNKRIPLVTDKKGNLFRYFNTWGPQVFRNKIVSDSYEPGSVMKALTMAAALNSDEVTPHTIYQDTGPVEVDEFRIRNSDKVYAGPTSMVSVLNRSLNTGIAFITRKMGKKLWYEYLRNFGFAQFTDIELPGEEEGQLEFWTDWAESELITRGFGQGILVTPLQMAMGVASLANGGYLMRPIIVEEIHYKDGRGAEIFHPEIVRRVVSDKTYNTIKSMLLSVVDKASGRAARVKGYSLMGKTGTSQTYRNGQALSGLGTTIATFGGFGPLKEPKFVILVKYDYPKTSQWGSETAAKTFGRVADFLFDYFNIPPDRNF